MGRYVTWGMAGILIALGTLWIGTLVHESGHILIALVCGANVAELNVLGLTLYPSLYFAPRPGYFGYVRFDAPLPAPRVQYMQMAGSLSTLALALLAQAVLWLGPPRRTGLRLINSAACFMWVDVVWHTVPVLLGRRESGYAETFTALVTLGVPRWLAAGVLLGISLTLLVLTLTRWWRLARHVSNLVPLSRKEMD